MNKLIDAAKLLTWFNNHYDDEEVTVGYVSGLIKEQPAIDATPVIRCKDCKHARKCYGDVVWTTKNGGFKYNPLGTDGFCSMAEREEETK